jgi:hypothetical protein
LAPAEVAATIAAPHLASEDGALKHRIFHIGVVLALIAPGIGCSPSVRMPRLFGGAPGPAAYQQHNAENYDPYPTPDLGPEVEGARPMAFTTPRPEVERARQYTNQQRQPQFIAPAPQPSF